MLAYTTATSAAFDTNALRTAWYGITAQSCPLHYNFHLHTQYSDGRLTPEALMAQAIQIGLKGMAITDHHSVQGFYLAQSYLNKRRKEDPYQPLPHLWTGIEITSLLDGVEVHILGYGFTPDHPSLQPYLNGDRPLGDWAEADCVIKALHSAGGLVVLAHPARYTKSAQELIPQAAELGVDGAEAYYAYGNPKPWIPSVRETQEALQLTERYRLFATCGTDTHGLDLLIRL
jgi:predicted metal-dependent phosphoesterase TrpH